MKNLRKLYLERNGISRLEGLQECRRLEELSLADQDHGAYEFTFDEYSLAGLASTLEFIDLKNCRVRDASPLYYLTMVRRLNLSDNQITAFDQIYPVLATINGLKDLDLRRNPVVQEHKYRD